MLKGIKKDRQSLVISKITVTFAVQNLIINSLKSKIMKANVNLASVREEFKGINGRSVNNVLSVIYALITENKEENKNTISLLNKILPSSKKKAKEYINDIILFGHVGETRTIKRKDGKEYTYEILPSVDMVLRFFVAKYNKDIPENVR